MAPFEELQSLWQNQPSRTASPEQAAGLSAAFRRYGRRNDLINYAKVLLIASQTIYLVTTLRHRPLVLFGACLAIFGAVLFMAHDWRTQRSIARLNFADPSTAFLRNAIARLNAQRNPFHTRQFYIAMTGFWAGSTLMMVAAWPKLDTTQRMTGHAMTFLLPLVVYRLGRFIRRKRFESECRPLIERLTAILETIEGGRA